MCSEEFQNTTLADSLLLSSFYMVIWATTSAAPLLSWQPLHHETIWQLQLGGLWHRPLLVCFWTNKRQGHLGGKDVSVAPVFCCFLSCSSRAPSSWRLCMDKATATTGCLGKLPTGPWQSHGPQMQNRAASSRGHSWGGSLFLGHWKFLHSNPGKNTWWLHIRNQKLSLIFSHPNQTLSNEFELFNILRKRVYSPNHMADGSQTTFPRLLLAKMNRGTLPTHQLL